jgi:site-specific DNA recombinase
MATRRLEPRTELRPGDPVDIYLRISRDPGHDELGVNRQERECRELVKRKGWTVSAVHVDDDKSAYSGKPRPGYEALLTRIERGQVRGVVAWHPDRLHRSPTELERFIAIIESSGAAVQTVQSGELDLSNASGRMTARVVGAVARHESEHKSERIRSKMLQLQRDGKLTGGGRRPYGFDYVKTADGKLAGLRLRDDEANVIRETVHRFVGGESLLSVVRDLNARGIRSSTGAAWGLNSMSYMLRSMRLAGLRDVDGKPEPAPWPAVISPREFRELQTLLARNKGRTRAPRSYLLTGGLIVCGMCGKPMIGRPIGGHPTYGCDKGRGDGRCGSVWIRAARVDDLVGRAVIAVVDGKGVAKKLSKNRGADRVLDAIEKQEKLVRDVEEDYANGEMQRDEYRRVRQLAESRLEDLRKSYQPTPSLDFGADNPLADAWPALPLGRRRAVLDVVLKAVRILPVGRGNTHAERVELDWKI